MCSSAACRVHCVRVRVTLTDSRTTERVLCGRPRSQCASPLRVVSKGFHLLHHTPAAMPAARFGGTACSRTMWCVWGGRAHFEAARRWRVPSIKVACKGRSHNRAATTRRTPHTRGRSGTLRQKRVRLPDERDVRAARPRTRNAFHRFSFIYQRSGPNTHDLAQHLPGMGSSLQRAAPIKCIAVHHHHQSRCQ